MTDTLHHIEPEAIFQNTTTSYKFFWCLGLLNLHQNTSDTVFECNDVILRMICEAFFVLDNNRITLGSADHFRSSMFSLKKLYSLDFGSANEMYLQIKKDISSKKVRKIISYYKDNVPFRFLTPWVPQNPLGSFTFDRAPLRQESVMFPAGAPYIIYKELDRWLIKLNPQWIEVYGNRHEELKRKVINCLSAYIAHRNEFGIDHYREFLEEIIMKNSRAVFHDNKPIEGASANRIQKTNNNKDDVQTFVTEVDRSISQDTIDDHVVTNSVSKDNVIRFGKVISIKDPILLEQVGILIGTNKLAAVKLLIDYFSDFDGITMSFKEWGALLDKIPEINHSEIGDGEQSDSQITTMADKKVYSTALGGEVVALSEEKSDRLLKTWLFTWNPKRWPWDDKYHGYLEMKHQIAQVGKAYAPWSCGLNKSIKAGDRVFLIRLGTEPRGIVASGFAATNVFEGLHWDSVRAANGDSCRRIYIEFDTILDAEKEAILPIDLLNIRFPSVHWSSQCSGIEVPSIVSTELDAIWKKYNNKSSKWRV